MVSPTMERRHKYHETLYNCFDAQTWTNKQLIVIDSGFKPSPFFASLEDERVIYIHREGEDTAGTLGEKRNAAIERADGEVIAHFDDDDIYAPIYLEHMVGLLRKSGHDVCKLKAWYTVDVETGRVGHFDGAKELPGAADSMRREMVYSYGFSILHTKQCWRKSPYPEVNWAEDQGFLTLLKLKGYKIAFYRDLTGICIHIQHGHNASRSVANTVVPGQFILDSPMCDVLPSYLRTVLAGTIDGEYGGGTHRGLFVCDIEGAENLDDRKKQVMKQWVGLELARWMKDPSVGSAQKELQGEKNSEAHKKADQAAAILMVRRHYANKAKEAKATN